MKTQVLSGYLFAEMVRGGAANLNNGRVIVNELNVFPIPDGDTGDNMFMTINSGANTVTGCADETLDEISSRIAKGMLLGARGNSGVILSRIFSGIARGFLGADSADVSRLGEALESGVKEAYGAVSVPVEGTILTVYKDAVRYANSRIGADSTIESYFDDFIPELRRSLDRTPELLAVLKEAGVVDSGGAGFVYIAEGMKLALEGGEITGTSAGEAVSAAVDLSSFNADSELEFGYCTEFLLQLLNSKINVATFDAAELIDWLNANGESVVAFRDGDIIKVHIHTMTPGVILNHCQKYGEYLTLKIENMTLQHNETTIRNRFEAAPPKPHKKYGIVTVASGSSICESFRELGVDYVVEGGQSMNPSAEDFIKAFDDVNADTILVYPNNGNVILTARQAAELYDKAAVCVIPSKTIGAGYAALSMLDVSSGDTEAIAAEQQEIIASVVTGMVSVASRDTEKDGIALRKGDYIGFSDDVIYSDAATRNEAALQLAERLDAGSRDVVIVIRGKDASAEETAGLCEALGSKYRRTEFIPMDGDQPVFDYIMIFE